MLIKLSIWWCLEIRMKEEITIWKLIVVPLKEYKIPNTWEQQQQIQLLFVKPQPPPSLLLGLEPVQSCLGVARVMSNYGYKKKNQPRSYLNRLVLYVTAVPDPQVRQLHVKQHISWRLVTCTETGYLRSCIPNLIPSIIPCIV